MSVVVHGRSEWVEPANPVTGPAFEPGRVKWIVLHYGGVDWSESRLRDPVRAWRDKQRDYSHRRGYSIGYQWGVDRDGELWELRGFDFRNAANGTTWPGSPLTAEFGGVNPNHLTVSMHVLLPLSGAYTPEQLAGVRACVAMIWQRLGRKVPVVPHSDINRTSCPGDPLRTAISGGSVLPVDPTPEPLPTPEPPGGPTVDQLICIARCTEGAITATCAVWAGGYKTWVAKLGPFVEWAQSQGSTVTRESVVNVGADVFRAMGPVLGARPHLITATGKFESDAWGV